MTKKNRVATIVAACIVIAAGVTGSVYAAVTVAYDKEEAESSTVVATEAETSTEATTEAVTETTTEVVTTIPATTTTTTAPATQTETTETTTEATTVDITGKMTKEQFKQIELGMTPEEVVAIVGSQPSKVAQEDNWIAYEWVAYDPRSTYPDCYSEIVFENGVVVSRNFVAPIKWY